MKLSLNWIKDYVDIPEGITLDKLAHDLTMSTVEVEKTADLGKEFDNMVVGVVREVRPHPNADKLVICITDVGDENLREIVCGGINVAEGMKVAVARPGAMVRWHGEGELTELKKAKVRSVESYGMICSSSEIGLFDLFPYDEEATIIDISDFDAEPGTGLAAALGLDDVILEIDNKSLTNRPDLWGHYGIAREIAAIYDLLLKPVLSDKTDLSDGLLSKLSKWPKTISCADNTFDIIIKDTELCPRYIGVRIEGVSVKPAPFEVQSRIWRVGMRPINAIVDITNYVMLATGQPTHAFDADIVCGNIIIRRAVDKEKLLLLSGKELSLTIDDLVIADEAEAIALAGVMGGEKDSILPETKNVILEIANFNALNVRRTSMRYDVRTEAATRFEKGIDPERADLAQSIAMSLFEQLFPEIKVTGYCDNYPNRLAYKEIHVSLNWLANRLGQKMTNDHLKGLLEKLGFSVTFEDDNMRVIAPTWRSTGDISIPDDIMEEVARIHGLENFKPTPIKTTFTGAINQREIELDRRVREYLAFSCGMNEVFTYPWVNDEYINATLGSSDGMLEMSSPPSPSERFLRSSLVPNMCKAVADNLRFFDEFAIFELAQVFFDKDYKAQYDSRELLPLQRKHVAGAFVTGREKYRDVFRRAKGAFESLARCIHIEEIVLARPDNAEKPFWADDVVWQSILRGGDKTTIIGAMGLLSQKAAQGCGIKNASVMLFELDIDALRPLASRENIFRHIPEYPMTEYDVSLVFDREVKWEDIQKTAAGKDGPDNLLRGVSFVEEYRGHQIPEGKKSVTIRLLIGSLKKTLTSDEIESCAAAVVKRLCKVLGGEARH